jgi:hypothetical protein
MIAIAKQDLELLSDYLERLQTYDALAVGEAKKIVKLLTKIGGEKVEDKLPTIEV